MYARMLTPQKDESFFLFGPRGTGKTTWITTSYPQSALLDLLDDRLYTQLVAYPTDLEKLAAQRGPLDEPIILDEIQKAPALLDEVHRLIEKKKFKFILTGSSARK